MVWSFSSGLLYDEKVNLYVLASIIVDMRDDCFEGGGIQAVQRVVLDLVEKDRFRVLRVILFPFPLILERTYIYSS